ncbi:hypothetical protein ABZ595_07130 [Streptomyces rubradiris]|uniref:hypothetical protein n=1 Tax=Streptomyces rubradiris TaxID=285531 RepID=UPI0033EF3C7B
MTLALAGCAYPTVDLGDLDAAQTPSAEQELLGRSLRLYKDAPSVTVTTRAAVTMGSPVAVSTDRRHNCRIHAQNGAFEVMVERGDRTWMSWGGGFLSLRGTDDPLYQALNGKWLALSTDGRIRKSMTDLCQLTALRQVVEQISAPGRNTARQPETTEDGERLTPLRQGSDGNSVTTFVAANGKPYPRKIVVDVPTFNPLPVDFHLSSYGTPVTIKPPEDTKTVSSANIEAMAEDELAANL